MNHPQAIIFDMDGLLIDSEPVWQMADRVIVETHGGIYDRAKLAHLTGLRADEVLMGICAVYGFDVDFDTLQTQARQIILDLMSKHAVVKPGSHEMVQYVQQHAIPRAIASSSDMSIIDSNMRGQGWADVFTIRCSGFEVPRSKPDPAIYLLAAERLGISPENCLALEDSPPGARAAVAAGMTCFAIPDPAHTSAEAFTDITDYIFADLHAVRACLESL